ncbi:hypothetical protein MRX96_022389 [Rhipicephalus microplus]
MGGASLSLEQTGDFDLEPSRLSVGAAPAVCISMEVHWFVLKWPVSGKTSSQSLRWAPPQGWGGRAVGGGSGGELISSKPENADSSFSGLGTCVRTSCSSLAGCEKSQESRVDSGEPDSWPLDSSRSPSELVLLVSSPRFGACVQGSGGSLIRYGRLPSLGVLRTASGPGHSLVVWGRVLGLRT